MAFAAAPIFLLMGFYRLFAASAALHGSRGSSGFLSSMWFMYGVMSVVHSGPWLSLAWQSFKTAAPKKER